MTLSIPADLEQMLRSTAKRRHVTVEQLVGEAIASYLRRRHRPGHSPPLGVVV